MVVKAIRSDYDMLVYIALVLVILVMSLAVLGVALYSKGTDPETCRLRLAGAALLSVGLLFVFSACLYYTNPEGYAGREIFDKGVIGIFTLAGSIIGYFFGAPRLVQQAAEAPAEPKVVPKVAKEVKEVREAKEPKEPKMTPVEPRLSERAKKLA